MNTLAFARTGESRGELLYATHCNACHSSEIHWREKKLATDWDSLKVQVRRWQANIGLNWSEEEVTEVAHYLNKLHYAFPVTGRKSMMHRGNQDHVLR